MCRCYPPPQPHQYQIQLEIYHVYIPGPAHRHPGRCWNHADAPMVSAIGTPLQKMYWCGTARHHLNIMKWKYKLKSTMCTCLHQHINMQAGVNTLYHADASMVIVIGTPLKVMCRCASVTHHCNPTNTKYNLKSTMCTSLHWHIHIQPGVHTMSMRRWSVQLKSTMCTCVHWHIDIHTGVHIMPMRRWSLPSALP